MIHIFSLLQISHEVEEAMARATTVFTTALQKAVGDIKDTTPTSELVDSLSCEWMYCLSPNMNESNPSYHLTFFIIIISFKAHCAAVIFCLTSSVWSAHLRWKLFFLLIQTCEQCYLKYLTKINSIFLIWSINLKLFYDILMHSVVVI